MTRLLGVECEDVITVVIAQLIRSFLTLKLLHYEKMNASSGMHDCFVWKCSSGFLHPFTVDARSPLSELLLRVVLPGNAVRPDTFCLQRVFALQDQNHANISTFPLCSAGYLVTTLSLRCGLLEKSKQQP